MYFDTGSPYQLSINMTNQMYFVWVNSCIWVKVHITCGWSDWFTLTRFTGHKVGMFQTSIIYSIRNWSKEKFSPTSIEDIANFLISWKIQRGDPSMTKKYYVWFWWNLKYRIRLNAAPGFYFPFWVFGWGSIQIWPTWGCIWGWVLLIRW